MIVDFKNNFQEIAEKWKKFPKQFEDALNIGFKEGLKRYSGYLDKEQLSGRKSENYGLNRQSGTAAMSLDVKTFIDSQDLVGTITVAKNAWYLKLHQHFEFNGYATAKGGTCFSIPVHPDAKGRRPSDFNLNFIKIPGRNPILIRRMFKGGNKRGGASVAGQQLKREDIMFVLTKKIYIPKRLYFYEEFKTEGNNMIIEQLNNRFNELMQKLGVAS